MSKKKSAFSYFLDDFIDAERKRGRDISKRVASEECGDLWQNLSPTEKEKYILRAKCSKSEKECSQEHVLLQDEYFSEISSGSKAGSEISYLVKHIRSVQALKNHVFYLIHVNYYCRTEQGVYIPGELALCKFSLESGVIRTYHTLIDPGKIPLGYAFEAKRLSDEVHGLPHPPYEGGKKDYRSLYNDICDLLQGSDESEEFPPLFTIENQIRPVKNILKRLSGESPTDFVLYPVHRLFFWLKNSCTEFCGNEPGFPVLSNAISEVEKDVFRYCTDICCQFHVGCLEKYQNCSLSVVQRLAFMICDHCCSHLGISLVRGCHVPLNSSIEKVTPQRSRFHSGASDTTSIPSENFSDYCGASSYAPSTVGDYQSDIPKSMREVMKELDDFTLCDSDSEE